MHQLHPLYLSVVFSSTEVVRDAAVALTFGPGSETSGSVCYALDAAGLRKANENPRIVAVITTAALAGDVAPEKGCVRHPQPQLAFYLLHNRLFSTGNLHPHQEAFIHPEARVASTARLGKHVVLGSGVIVDHGAVLEDFTMVGEGTYVGPHCSIGARGVYNSYLDGINFRVACAGAVRIGKRCEVLSGAVVAKSYLREFTELADDVKIGSRASVGHGCNIGAGSIVGANSVLAGNVKLGRQVWTGPNVSVADGLEIGEQARVLIGSVVVQKVRAGETVSGNFAIPHAVHLRNFTRLRHEL